MASGGYSLIVVHKLLIAVASLVAEHRLQVSYSNVYIGEGNGNPLQYSCLDNPWVEEPGRLQSMGSLRVGCD